MKSVKETRKTTKKAPPTLRTAKASSPETTNGTTSSALGRIAAAAKASAPAKRTSSDIKPAPVKEDKLQPQPATTAGAPSPSRSPASNAKPATRETTIEAKIDVGFGNSVFVRGNGAGLSWDHGIPLRCVDGITWRWSAPASSQFTFKLLLNDSVWAQGEDLSVAPGQKVEATPVF